MKKVKKFYIDTSGGPGLFQYFYYPSHLRHGLHVLSEAKKSKSKEAIRDAHLNIFNLSAGAVYSFSALASMLAQVQVLFSYLTYTASRVSPVVGIAASCFANFVELRNLQKQRNFQLSCNHLISELKEGILNKDSLSFILKYIDTKEPDPIRLCRLAIRVKPWFAEKLAIELPAALENAQTELEKIEKILKLVTSAKSQAEKKMIELSLVLLANAVLIAGFTAALAFQPHLVLMSLFAVNVGIVAFNYFFARGTQNQEGWNFSLHECIPFKHLREGFLRKA